MFTERWTKEHNIGIVEAKCDINHKCTEYYWILDRKGTWINTKNKKLCDTYTCSVETTYRKYKIASAGCRPVALLAVG